MGLRIKMKTHMLVGGLAGLAVFFHWIAAGFSAQNSIAFLALLLFFLTIMSGVIAKSVKNKKLIYVHIISSVTALAVMSLHIMRGGP